MMTNDVIIRWDDDAIVAGIVRYLKSHTDVVNRCNDMDLEYESDLTFMPEVKVARYVADSMDAYKWLNSDLMTKDKKILQYRWCRCVDEARGELVDGTIVGRC